VKNDLKVRKGLNFDPVSIYFISFAKQSRPGYTFGSLAFKHEQLKKKNSTFGISPKRVDPQYRSYNSPDAPGSDCAGAHPVV
jgi:hypothetical protein